MRIENSIALVTGSARRIGRAITVVHYRSSEDDARRTLDEVRRIGAEGAMFQADLTVDEDRARLFEGIRDEWGALDILVNSASVFESRRFDETTPDFWDSQMDANARAPFFVAQAAARLMKGREGAKIINIADPAGELIWPQYLAYSISKSALLGLNRGLAKALAPGIQVNAVAPEAGGVHRRRGPGRDLPHRERLHHRGSPPCGRGPTYPLRKTRWRQACSWNRRRSDPRSRPRFRKEHFPWLP
jgi:NAD(P)-dependent dehydrogenase (short-subunit alcohol dehydrogenase family)